MVLYFKLQIFLVLFALTLKEKLSIFLIIAAEGFVVIMLQILAAVLITPFWGNTFLFWTINLFLTLLSLGLGYMLSGFVINKFNKTVSFIFYAALFTIVYLSVIISNYESIFEYLITTIESPVGGIFLSLFCVQFLPILLLASFPPLISHLIEKEYQNSSSVGLVFGISSLTGVISAFVLPLWLIPNMSVYAISLIGCLTIFLCAVLSLKSYFKQIKYALPLILIVSFLMFITLGVKSKSPKTNFKDNVQWKTVKRDLGLFGELKIIDNPYTQSRYLMVNNVSQTKAHFTGRSLYSYLYSLSIYSSVKPLGAKVLLGGFGAGNLVYELTLLGFEVDVVDIDERLPKFVKNHFLLPQSGYNFINADVRRYIKTTSKKYDIVILDLSYGETVPTNVYTKECFGEIDRILKQDGVTLIHFVSNFDEDGIIALKSIGKTLKSSGWDYKIMNRLNAKSIEENNISSDNYIFCAAKKVDFSNYNFRIDPDIPKELVPQKDNLYLSLDDEGGKILTDDKPFLDVLQTKNTIRLRKQNIDWWKQRHNLSDFK